jgi:hypothetical protein
VTSSQQPPHEAPLPEHESPLRRMMADAAGRPYIAFRNLSEAHADPDGVVILEGDDGGQIYVVFPASAVRAPEPALNQLLIDLDSIAWPGQPDMARITFEHRPVGAGISGGMGGGVVEPKGWIHQEFVRLGLEEEIRGVIDGSRDRIEPRSRLDLARAYWRGGMPRDAGAIVYEALEQSQRPGWAASLLAFAVARVPAPETVATTIAIAREPARWLEARRVFDELRGYTLRVEASKASDMGLLSILHLAENTAKVTYNASGLPAPFDHDSGWWVASNLFDVATALADPDFADKALNLLVAPLEEAG